ncbi:MAG: 1-acyl-sn-glycerol-3-phosphate acyltransferase [Bacteroidaceae bacterium]|nr:1-acyl-sn-glycerol-3-phosphate acyltransferase [Bacteroidaceae bacterium]
MKKPLHPEIAAFPPALTDKLCVIIPTYNNAGSVATVALKALEYIPAVIVVDDGSTDSTSRELAALGDSIIYVGYAQNRGKGHALITGFRKARELGYKYAITIDADGQHRPEEIPLLLKAEMENPDAIIIGSRTLEGKEISKGSLFANRFSNFWFTVQTAQRLPDTQTGYRLYPLHKLHWTKLVTSRYESELELLVFANWNNTRIVPVPIDVYYPPKEERVSHFRPAYDFTRISILNTFLCFGAVLYGYPCKLLRLVRTLLYTLFALLIFLVGTPLMTLFSFIYFGIRRKTAKSKLLYHKILSTTSHILLRIIPGTRLIRRNPWNEDFRKPAVIICNHQSQFDLLCAIMLNPKTVILTKDWVWNNPLFGRIVKFADYYPVSGGIDNCMEHLKRLNSEGYSILVFPEGTRSADSSILRFHKGAFHIANELKLDIVPVFIHGTGHVLQRNRYFLRTGKIYIETDKRVKHGEETFGTTVKEQRKNFEQYYKEKYNNIKIREGYE